MTYDETKRELRKVESQAQAGDVAGADAAIRAMAGRGITRADMDANLSSSTMRKLRNYARKNR